MTIEDLRALCLEWQARLRLSDWQITVEYVRNKATDDTWWGTVCRWEAGDRWAVIQLVDPSSLDMIDYPYGHYDVEETLVHELLHIYTEGIQGRQGGTFPRRNTAEDTYAEQMADAVSAALVVLKRSGVAA